MPGTPTYKSAKFLLKFLSPSTANEYTVNDSFHFAEEICQQDSNKHMTSLDVDSLFSNHIMKPLVFVLITSTMTTRISLTSQTMIFVICLTETPNNFSLNLTTNIINK